MKKDTNSLEGEITYDELLNVYKIITIIKDGFTYEFDTFFLKDIGIYLLRSINEGFKKEDLSVTQKQGIITCIPKGDKPLFFKLALYITVELLF